jgi:hypothetical protein
MRGLAAIAILSAACVLVADAASARSKSPRPHARPAVSERADRASTGSTKDSAVGQLDRVLGTRIKSICRGC